MDIFAPIFNQMLFLFAFILIGYILSKYKFIPENSTTVLSKLENIVFVPALIMGTFIENCTPKKLASTWELLLFSGVLVTVSIFLSIFMAKRCFKDKFLQNIVTYGLAFSNFGFMGNAIMSKVFPDIFFEYALFTLPFWFMIYLWGAPVLLIGSQNGEKGIKSRLKAFLNPMLIGMVIGMIIGLTGLELPSAIKEVINVSGDCMSPIAMILTGITIAKIDILSMLKKWRLYIVTAIKLLIYPLLYIAVAMFLPKGGFINETVLLCAMCVMSMPMGLNTIVVPAAYGKDTSDAAALALITHTFSVITIPLMFMLFQAVVL